MITLGTINNYVDGLQRYIRTLDTRNAILMPRWVFKNEQTNNYIYPNNKFHGFEIIQTMEDEF